MRKSDEQAVVEAGQFGDVLDIARRIWTVGDERGVLFPKTLGNLFFILALVLFDLGFVFLVLSIFLLEQCPWIADAVILLYLGSILAILLMFVVEARQAYKALRSLHGKMHGDVRKDLTKAASVLVDLRSCPRHTLESVKSYIDFWLAKRKEGICFIVGPMEKFGLLPGALTLALGAGNLLEKHPDSWQWATSLLLGLYFFALLIRTMLSEFEAMSWVIGEALEQGKKS